MIESSSTITSTRRAGAAVTVAAACVLVLTGCPDESPGAEEPAPEEPAPEVEVDVLDEARFAKLLEDNRGHVVLVDFWALWCSGCVELLPHTVELHERYGGKGLRVVTVSLDEPQQKDAVLELLRQKEASLPNYISKYGAGDKSFDVFDIRNGTLPHFKLYDRDGKLAETFPAAGENVDPKEIDRAVKELLAAR